MMEYQPTQEPAFAPEQDALTRRFDEAFARMQGAAAARAMADAFATAPAELGKAAVRAARTLSAAL